MNEMIRYNHELSIDLSRATSVLIQFDTVCAPKM